MNTRSQKTMEQLYKDTLKKVNYLESHGFVVEQKWECELEKELKEDEEMRQFFDEYEIVGPLQPRDAFYGGRTNATKLFHECQGDEKIKYHPSSITLFKMVRVTSLLPLFTGMLILQVYTRGVIKIRTMLLAILKLSLRILQTFLPTLG